MNNSVYYFLYITCWIYLCLACDDDQVNSDNQAPTLLPLQEVNIQANQTVSVEIFAQDAEQEVLQFSFTMDPLPQTQTEGQSAIPTLQSLSSHKAIFQWTPGIADEGIYQLNFTVTDPQGATDSETMRLSVIGADQQGISQILFIQPAGSGRTIDISQTPCLTDVVIQVKADALPEDEIQIKIADPIPLGLSLNPATIIPGKRKLLNWCPTEEQLTESNRYKLNLVATQKSNERSITKEFLLNFITPQREDCLGRPPVIEHQVTPIQNGLADYQVITRILDDFGIKSPPLLEYIINPAVDPRSQINEEIEWNLVEFEKFGMDEWQAFIPNANLMENERLNIYYRILATDNDDAEGALCDHHVESEIYVMQVEGGGDQSTFTWCESCSHHQQCGGVSDLCLVLDDGSFCGQNCDPNQNLSSCPNGSTCLAVTLETNETAYQCVPNSNTCGQACVPDQFDQDIMSQQEIPLLQVGLYEQLAICQEDADFYFVRIPSQQQLSVSATFATSLDLDLAIAIETDAEGQAIYDYVSQQPTGESEQITLPCLPNTTDALIVIYPYETESNEGNYQLSIDLQNNCQECVNDTIEQETAISINSGVYTNLKICPNDVDQYLLTIPASHVLSMWIAFDVNLGNLNARLISENGREVFNVMGRNNGILIEQRIETGGNYILEVTGSTALVNNSYQIDFYSFFAASCQETRDCSNDTFCYPSLGCVDVLCDESLSCGADHECIPSAMLSERDMRGTGACAQNCYFYQDCRAQEACKNLPDAQLVCISVAQASQGLGANCSAHEECLNQLSCVDINGVGYCLSGGCDQYDPCEENEVCMQWGAWNLCLPQCSQQECPGNLQCQQIDGDRICIP